MARQHRQILGHQPVALQIVAKQIHGPPRRIDHGRPAGHALGLQRPGPAHRLLRPLDIARAVRHRAEHLRFVALAEQEHPTIGADQQALQMLQHPMRDIDPVADQQRREPVIGQDLARGPVVPPEEIVGPAAPDPPTSRHPQPAEREGHGSRPAEHIRPRSELPSRRQVGPHHVFRHPDRPARILGQEPDYHTDWPSGRDPCDPIAAVEIGPLGPAVVGALVALNAASVDRLHRTTVATHVTRDIGMTIRPPNVAVRVCAVRLPRTPIEPVAREQPDQ